MTGQALKPTFTFSILPKPSGNGYVLVVATDSCTDTFFLSPEELASLRDAIPVGPITSEEETHMVKDLDEDA